MQPPQPVIERAADRIIVFPCIRGQRNPDERVEEANLLCVELGDQLEDFVCYVFPAIRADGQLHVVRSDDEREVLAIELVVVAREGIVELGPVVIGIAVVMRLSKIAARVDEDDALLELVEHDVRERVVAVDEMEFLRHPFADVFTNLVFHEEDVAAVHAVDADAFVMRKRDEVLHGTDAVERLPEIVRIDVFFAAVNRCRALIRIIVTTIKKKALYPVVLCDVIKANKRIIKDLFL